MFDWLKKPGAVALNSGGKMQKKQAQTGLNPPDAALENSSGLPQNSGVAAREIESLFDYYLGVHCYTQSPKTIEGKRHVARLLAAFLARRGHDHCGRTELAEFIRHVQFGHKEPEGRWGRGGEDERCFAPTRPRTAQLYFDYLKSFFQSLVEDGTLESSPLILKRPRVPREEIVPFSREQCEALLAAARVGRCPERDVAIITLILDAGLRRAEICNLRRGDLDLPGHTLAVTGKRNKRRLCAFGDETAKALLVHLRTQRALELGDDDFLFCCSRARKGQPLKPDAVYEIFKRHGRVAGLKNVRCSPHTMRHTFATEFMLAGASQRAAMRQLGHEDSAMTLRYQHVADAQMATMHRVASPADNLKKSGSARSTPAITPPPDKTRNGGRPRQPLENYPCTCGQCGQTNKPKKSCPRGNVLYKRLQRERAKTCCE